MFQNSSNLYSTPFNQRLNILQSANDSQKANKKSVPILKTSSKKPAILRAIEKRSVSSVAQKEPLIFHNDSPNQPSEPISDSTHYIPRQKLIIDEEQAVVKPSSSCRTNRPAQPKFGRLKDSTKNFSALALSLNQIISNKQSSLQTFSVPKKHITSENATLTKIESLNAFSIVKEIASSELCAVQQNNNNSTDTNNHKEDIDFDDLGNRFKSVREKIEYFSGNLTREKLAAANSNSNSSSDRSAHNLSHRSLTATAIYQSQPSLVESFTVTKSDFKSSFQANLTKQIEILSSLRVTNPCNITNRHSANLEECDSLKLAYKLNAIRG